MPRIETGYDIEGYESVFNDKTVEVVDCNYINWTSNKAYSTFINSPNLKKVTNLSANITNMYKTFENCISFTELDAFPQSVTIMEDTFRNCTALKQLPDLPNSVTTMINTFRGCTNITSAPIIPDSVLTMTNAFADCTSLRYAQMIGNSVTTMTSTFENCISLSSVGKLSNTLYSMTATFRNCTNLTTPPVIPNTVTSLLYTYKGCSRITTPPNIPNSVTNMAYTFQDCVNLTDMPELPNSITELPSTFMGCLNLINTSTIPNSITSLVNTYQDCINLANMPIIPTSIIDMSSTFKGCTGLTNVTSIPTSVTNMYKTFYGCTGITQDLIITSQNVTNAIECFNATSTLRNVYIPFTDSNGINTPTYNAFITAGYRDDGSVNGVKLRDLTIANIAVNPIPVDSTITLAADGYSQGPNSITVKKGTPVTWTVEHYGYQTLTGTLTPNEDQTINVTLSKDNFTLTINPTPADALVTLTTGSIVHQGNTLSAPYESVIHYKVEHPDYFTQEGDIDLTMNITQDITLVKTHYDVTINPTPSDATVILTCGGTTTINHTISAPYMGNVHWKVSKDGYNTREGDYLNIIHDINENIILVDPNAEIYINSNVPITTTWTVPKDGIYEILAVGGGGGGAAQGDKYKGKSSSASGGSGAYFSAYYKLTEGTVLTYRIAAGGVGTGTEGWGTNGLRGADGESTYVSIYDTETICSAGGGTGGYVKFTSNYNPIREAGIGGKNTFQSNYVKLISNTPGNNGNTTTNINNTAIGAAPVYSNYGGGGDATATGHNKGDGKNGGNGYLKITRIVADPLYENSTGGNTEQLNIAYSGKYKITLVGAGGTYEKHRVYGLGAYEDDEHSGGSGALVTGTIDIEAGQYTATVGKAASDVHTSFMNQKAKNGGNGTSDAVGVVGTYEISSSGLTGIEGEPGQFGYSNSFWGSSNWPPAGGASKYEGYGAGGNHTTVAKDGYIKIEWVGE